MSIYIWLIILLLHLAWWVELGSPASTSCTSTPPPVEVMALQALYNSTDGEAWKWKSTGKIWKFDGIDTNPCNGWEGIQCVKTSTSSSCHVNSLILDNYGLSGTLPESLSNLKNLTILQLTANPALSGSIPTRIGEITGLLTLRLYKNALNGSIPASVTKLTSLTLMYVYENVLEGNIPENIGNMKSLANLALYSNQLTGTIPNSITQLTAMKYLYLYRNTLNGSIPSNIGNLKNIIQLELYTNKLTGIIPTSITQLKVLQVLYLYDNSLQGSIPEAIGNMTSLLYLELNSNQLSGTIPTTITLLTALKYLLLSSNYLRGNIPEDIGNMKSLTYLALYSNQLTGTIPASVTKLTSLQYIYLYQNILNGSIPQDIGKMINLLDLEFFENQLTGTIPSSITELTSLKYLYLSDNSLHGNISENIGNMRNLIVLALFSNQLTGTIPASIGQLNALGYLYLQSNVLHGSISTTIGNMENVLVIDLSTNYLRGNIPEDIGNMKSVLVIDFSANQLNGTIPTSIANLTSLQYLYLQKNKLKGDIPDDIGNMGSLITMGLFTNQLTGTIPASITKLKLLQRLYLYNNLLHGSIPKDIGNMASLNDIELSTNRLQGTIPVSITKLILLKYLYLSENALTGNIPEEIGNLKNLVILLCNSNQLSGTIPASITYLTILENLYLNQNKIHGSIPENIGNMTNLDSLGLPNNHLTGSIPHSIVQLKLLRVIELYDNSLHGTLPKAMGNMTILVDLDVSFNEISGSFPTSFNQLHRLNSIVMTNNQLTGAIDLLGTDRSNLTTLKVANNVFTAILHIPSSLKYVDLSNNKLQGNVKWMTTLAQAISISLSNNSLTGTLPSSQDLASNLSFFQVATNLFTGPITRLVDPARQIQLQLLDLNNNALTGSIPTSLFEFPNLTYVILAQNCLTGSIPATVCAPKKTLQVLVLDGLHAASTCETRLFPGIPQIHSLANTHVITGSIPACLFGEMSVLQTLHISGNGLTGSLPDEYAELGRKLQQLILSHNALVGTIPLVFQHHGFTELDVSFNLLTGELSSNMNVSGYAKMQEAVDQSNGTFSTTGLRLNNNRLSGDIPMALLELQYIDILAGNMFGCDNDDRVNTLPRNDDEFDTYMCDSEEVNTAMISYIVIVVILLVVFALYMWAVLGKRYLSEAVEQLRRLFPSMIHYQDGKYPIDHFLYFLQSLRKHVGSVTVAIVVIFVVCYGVLSVYFATYKYKYAWTISIGYLSGVIPGTCLFILMVGMLLSERILRVNTILVVQERQPAKEEHEDGLIDKKMTAVVVAYVLIDIVVVLTINCSFVLLVLSGLTSSEQTMLTIALALFKDGWRWLVMSSLKWRSIRSIERAWGADSTTRWLLFICLFNNLIAPCIATAFVNTNCFFYAVVPAANVEYSNAGNEITFCEQYYTTSHPTVDGFTGAITYSFTTGDCEYALDVLISTSFRPSFTYSYQCTSSLMSIFAPAWLYMFLFGGIIAPITNWLIYVEDALKQDQVNGKSLNLDLKTLNFASWVYARMVTLIGLKKAHNEPKRMIAKFDDRKQVVILCNNLIIMLSFGVLFPPIAVVGCIAILVQLMMQELLVLDLMHACNSWLDSHMASASNASAEQHQNDNICNRKDVERIIHDNNAASIRFIHTYLNTVKVMTLYVSVVWGLFLWDIVGGEVGLVKSIWVFLLMVIIGVVLMYGDKWLHPSMTSWMKSNDNKAVQATNNQSSNTGDTTIELTQNTQKDINGTVIVQNPLISPSIVA